MLPKGNGEVMFDWIQRLLATGEAPRRPKGMSRRGFLRAIGVTTMTASGLYLAKPALMLGSRPGLVRFNLTMNEQDFIDAAKYMEDGIWWNFAPRGEPFGIDYWIVKNEALKDPATKIRFDVPPGPNFKPRTMFVASQG